MYRIFDKIYIKISHDKPRYLMGLGKSEDIIEGVCHVIEMFDGVMPNKMPEMDISWSVM